jgi:hypothetical protein
MVGRGHGREDCRCSLRSSFVYFVVFPEMMDHLSPVSFSSFPPSNLLHSFIAPVDSDRMPRTLGQWHPTFGLGLHVPVFAESDYRPICVMWTMKRDT